MKNILKAKHFNPESAWRYVWDNYTEFRTKDEVESLIEQTVAETKSVCSGHKPAYAWSGGKDSIAMQIVCEEAGINNGFCAYNQLFFSESIDFFFKNKPKGIVMIDTGEDYDWLARHPSFLFPPSSTNNWSERTHLKCQTDYVKKYGADLILMGKRTQDGNWVPKDSLIKVGANGVPIYCPIRNWTHEDVICAIRYRGKTISNFYFKDGGGFHYGDTKFALMSPMKGETVSDAWNRIYKLEPEKVVRSAEAGIPSAIEYLRLRRTGLYD